MHGVYIFERTWFFFGLQAKPNALGPFLKPMRLCYQCKITYQVQHIFDWVMAAQSGAKNGWLGLFHPRVPRRITTVSFNAFCFTLWIESLWSAEIFWNSNQTLFLKRHLEKMDCFLARRANSRPPFFTDQITVNCTHRTCILYLTRPFMECTVPSGYYPIYFWKCLLLSL